MQITETESVTTSATVMGPSLVLDLSWIITRFQKHERKSDFVEQFFVELDRYEDQLTGFWSDGMRGFAEVEVLAHLAKALEIVDFSEFRQRCDETLRSRSLSLDVALISEGPDVEAILLARLRSLRDSEGLRERYFTLLKDVWSVVAVWWGNEGIRTLNRVAAETQRKLASGTPWYELVDVHSSAFDDRIAGIMARYEGGKPVKIAPCAFFGKALYFEFDEYILIGFGTGSDVDNAKQRVAGAIGPLRALADPTRLAIYEFLKRGPSTVKEISESFSLSQPTVSVHVKRLRDVGLVTATRNGTQLEIDIDRAAAEAVSNTLSAVLTT
jgi:ArsR family transcriptional regulator, arsenate/arsenite/antimonite-responsive transcriptional repressor